MDSERLARGLRTADPLIIQAIYSGPIGNKIRRMVRKMGGNQFKAENILTPVIMRMAALIRKGKYAEEGKCESYLYVTAIYVWKEECKKKGRDIWKRHKPVEMEEELFEIIASADEPILSLEEEVEAAKQRQKILEYINELDPKCKELIQLRYLEGYQLNEIAEIMDLSKNYPNVLNGRCLERLRKLLSDEEPGQE